MSQQDQSQVISLAYKFEKVVRAIIAIFKNTLESVLLPYKVIIF